MVRKLIIILFMSAALVAAFSSCRKNEPEYDYLVEFEDPAFEYAVRQQLKTPDGDIYYKALKDLSLVYIWPNMIQFNDDEIIVLPDGVRISSAGDLKHFGDLQGILLANLKYENIDLISELKTLKRVILFANLRLTDISALENLPNLIDLGIYDNPNLRDFSVLSKLQGLVELNLSNCGLTDISFLEGISTLKILYLDKNEITDISPLSESKGMLELTLTSNKLTDISAIANLTRMNTLRMAKNQITDLSPLSSLEVLRTLNIENNNVSDLSPLANKPLINRVWVDGNPLITAEVIAEAKKILPKACEIIWSGN